MQTYNGCLSRAPVAKVFWTKQVRVLLMPWLYLENKILGQMQLVFNEKTTHKVLLKTYT